MICIPKYKSYCSNISQNGGREKLSRWFSAARLETFQSARRSLPIPFGYPYIYSNVSSNITIHFTLLSINIQYHYIGFNNCIDYTATNM